MASLEESAICQCVGTHCVFSLSVCLKEPAFLGVGVARGSSTAQETTALRRKAYSWGWGGEWDSSCFPCEILGGGKNERLFLPKPGFSSSLKQLSGQLAFGFDGRVTRRNHPHSGWLQLPLFVSVFPLLTKKRSK